MSIYNWCQKVLDSYATCSDDGSPVSARLAQQVLWVMLHSQNAVQSVDARTLLEGRGHTLCYQGSGICKPCRSEAGCFLARAIGPHHGSVTGPVCVDASPLLNIPAPKCPQPGHHYVLDAQDPTSVRGVVVDSVTPYLTQLTPADGGGFNLRWHIDGRDLDSSEGWRMQIDEFLKRVHPVVCNEELQRRMRGKHPGKQLRDALAGAGVRSGVAVKEGLDADG